MISEYYPTVPAPAQDGIFGSETARAVTAFQQLMQLNTDGIVGMQTWKKLYDVYLGIVQNVPVPKPETGTVQYIVQPGDTLWSLARRYGTSVDAIKIANGLTSDQIQIGQILNIPISQTESYLEYTVQPGDTLWAIARKYNTTVRAIQSLNNLNGTLINIGQILRIPKS